MAFLGLSLRSAAAGLPRSWSHLRAMLEGFSEVSVAVVPPAARRQAEGVCRASICWASGRQPPLLEAVSGSWILGVSGSGDLGLRSGVGGSVLPLEVFGEVGPCSRQSSGGSPRGPECSSWVASW